MKAESQRLMRVFISSTFRDMQEEREELVKRVFPRVRIGDALDINPVLKLGLGARIRSYSQGTVSVEGAYRPFKGPTYVITPLLLP